MLEEALTRYGFDGCHADELRYNENHVYKITKDGAQYVLRIHQSKEGFDLSVLRGGENAARLLDGELEILEHLSNIPELGTQKVMRNINGERATLLSAGVPVSVLGWIDGDTLCRNDASHPGYVDTALAYQLGAMLRRLHIALKEMPCTARYHYDATLLQRLLDESANAQKQNHFTPAQAEAIDAALTYIRDFLANNNGELQIVHSDLQLSNLIYDGRRIKPIDFSLAGYGLPELDIASINCQLINDELCRAILEGYTSIDGCTVNQAAVDAMTSLQILLFIVCQHNRFAGEEWFAKKLDDWCGEFFRPLVVNSRRADPSV